MKVLLMLLCLALLGATNGDNVAGIKAVRDELMTAAKMPEESQKALLNVMGAGLVAAGQLECNLFGGKSACVDIPNNSKYAKTCAVSNFKVDCAFKTEALQEMSRDPHVVMREKLAREGFPPCDACFDALHLFWCGQTVPTCGTFEEVLDEILPVINKAANGKGNPVDELQKAVPKILEAFSLGLPCREMCESITSTCSCGRPTTFGQVMSILEKNKKTYDGGVGEFSTNMSAATAKSLFSSVWDKPVCDLFAPSSMPGFTGVCDLAPHLQRCGWCKSSVRGPQDAEAQIVAQMAESISGMMQAGLQKILDTAGSSLRGHSKPWSWHEEEPQHSKHHSGRGTGVIVTLVLLAGVVGAAAAWYIYRKRQVHSQYMDLNNFNSMGYNPPVL